MVCQCQTRRLACIPHQVDAEQIGDAMAEIDGVRHLRPMGHPLTDLVGGHIFRGHQPRRAPIALEGVGISQVLAHLGGAFAEAKLVGEDERAALGFARQGDGEAEIGRIEIGFVGVECPQGSVLMPARDLGEGQREDGALRSVTQLPRFGERGGRRFETARFDIGRTQQRAQIGVARRCQHGAFREGDGLVALALGQGAFGLDRRNRSWRRFLGAASTQSGTCQRGGQRQPHHAGGPIDCRGAHFPLPKRSGIRFGKDDHGRFT